MYFRKYYLIIFCMGVIANAQKSKGFDASLFVIPEISSGFTQEANTGFPDRGLQRSLFISIGKYSRSNSSWAKELGYPKTGISIGATDLGNLEKLGVAYSLMPFVEFGMFKKRSNRWNLNVGFGAGYITKQYDPETNPFNLAITTKVNWTFRSFFYYDFLKNKRLDWRIGLGYTHFSNGHIRLPNQGLNSLLVNVSALIGKEPQRNISEIVKEQSIGNRSVENYFSFRSGIGQNVLSRIFNDKKEVYSVAISGGKIINSTFKYGGGAYYRFYEQYYDHIKNDGQLISEQVPEYTENPFRYATNFGFFGSSELLLGHVGILFGLGINIYKPFYKIDWQLSQGFFFEGEYVRLGELGSYYRVKRTISSRLGVKYYLFNTSKSFKNNFFVSASLNANFGQADFSELSVGYEYRFNRRTKKRKIFK